MKPVKRISGDSPFEESVGFSRAIRVGDRVVTSLTAPISRDGPAAPTTEGQVRRCIEIIEEALGRAGATLDDVIRTEIYFTAEADTAEIDRLHAEFFGHVRPVIKMLPVVSLEDPTWMVEIEVEAVIDAR